MGQVRYKTPEEIDQESYSSWFHAARISRRQSKQQLLADGLLDQIQPAIDAIVDPIERGMVQIYWDDADSFERKSPELIAIGEALGLTSDQIDTMFKEAEKR